ncbi:CHC2 zinc finger domain-containing protein [Clostridium sp. E02]|uniref:CHC2 zinc finger domain-containing protein n=1 Tax=Clostridium sp. E02 TaxID=2487134 RepID=UPI000F51F720|nr:CHC2 zinc finger domain-containing protein [Clostridium sp. E02]
MEEIKDTYSMKDVVERYGFQPNRRGFISCPFHTGDRSPSLKVYDKDFHCHACGANGDIFSFIQMMDNLTFREAFMELGGTYQSDGKMYKSQILKRKREREVKRRKEEVFKSWKLGKLDEVCRLLRLYDALERIYEPLSDEWTVVVNKKQRLEEEYRILVFGIREEQEEMRNSE